MPVYVAAQVALDGIRSMGYFSFERFVSRDQAKSDEIALNPEYFATRPVEDVLSTLVHEQVHQWQRRFGTPPRRGYHDQEFAAKMEAIGLMPSNTGTPGGKTTGEKMSHYIMANGPFIHACKELLQTSFVIVWYDRFPVQIVREYEFAADTTVAVASAGASVSTSSSGVQWRPGRRKNGRGRVRFSDTSASRESSCCRVALFGPSHRW
jgi:hypothetical protein